MPVSWFIYFSLPKSRALLPFLFLLGVLICPVSLFAQENCTNGIDDDGDGYIDCFDGDCSSDTSCAEFYFGAPSPACQFIPSSSTLSLVQEWSGGPVSGHSVLVVGDLDGDGIPEIIGRNQNLIGLASQQGNGGASGIRIFNGKTGALSYSPTTLHIPFTNNGFVIADADGNGYGEFYYITAWNTPNGDDRKLVCYEFDPGTNDFTLKWKSNSQVWNNQDGVFYTPEICDFNADGVPELYAGNQIFNSLTGALIASGGFSNSKGWSNCSYFHPVANTVAADVLNASSILPATGNPCGSDCDGLELIAGNQVYSVDIASGTMELAMVAANSLPDGAVSILDYDLDGDLDAAITYVLSNTARVYIWDLQSPQLLANLRTLQSATQTNVNVGRANVGDFDNDGKPELGICTQGNYCVIDDYQVTAANTGNLQNLWSISTSDNSGMTNATVFDFEGDGSFEIVYRDEGNVRILRGSNGSQLASIACSSPTASEYPIVADIDADGETEIVCSCGGVVNGQLKAFKSNNKPWIPARKVWNQHSYFSVNVNDDLTIPRVQQRHHIEFPQASSGKRPLNIFLAQSTILDNSGEIAFPAADAEISIFQTVCSTDSVEVFFRIANKGSYILPQIPIRVYSANPLLSNATIITSSSTTALIEVGDSLTASLKVSKTHSAVFLVANDNGSKTRPYNLATDFPITSIAECYFPNNIDSVTLGGGANGETTHTLCAGDSLLYPLSPQAGSSYTWSSSAHLSDSSIANPFLFPPQSDTFFLQIVDPFCTQTTRVIVDVKPIPSISLSIADDTICLGSEVMLNAVLTNEETFRWTPASILNDSLSTSPLATPTQSGFIFLTALNGACRASDSVAITLLNAPTFTKMTDTGACIGEQVQLSVTGLNGGSFRFQWSPATNLNNDTIFNPILNVGQAQHELIVRIFLNQCEAFDTVLVSGTTRPLLPPLNDTFFCEGESIAFNFNTNPAYDYRWTPSAYVEVDTVLNTRTTMQNSGFLKLRISDNGCTVQDSFFIRQESPPTIDFLTNKQDLCLGDSIEITVLGGSSYSWPDFAITQSTVNRLWILPSEPRYYAVRVDSSNGCFAIDSIYIDFAPPPELLLDSIYYLCFGQGLNFFTTQTGQTYLMYDSNLVIQQQINGDGKYYIETSNSCNAIRDSILVFTSDEALCAFEFPNAFSPNFNGLNDRFPFGESLLPTLQNCQIFDYHLQIYSRWGELLFESYDPAVQWDGHYKDEFAISSVYLWMVQYRYWDACNNSYKNVFKKGNVTQMK